ncbi:uncharacterized protein LOC142769333 [Rhipicephalus microplus]|uniref:uncharacterized protein LOC142769333 n=1 Tax=Rhipicephalus microplus TaxID=6941 RepID=UPI002376603F
MHRDLGAGTSSGYVNRSINVTRRTTSLAEVLEAARESKLILPPPEMEREALRAPAAPHLERPWPSRSSPAKCKSGPAPAVAAASAPAPPRSSAGNLASVLVLFTVSIVTAGFVACAVATGRYIAAGGVYAGMRGRFGDGERNVGPSMDLQGPPAASPGAVPPANSEDAEAEKLARRFMIQPVEEASPDGVSEAGPATEPFKDIAAAAEGRTAMPVAGRKRVARTSQQPAREAKMPGWAASPAVGNNTDASDSPAEKNASVTSDDQIWNLTLH